jgi:hypothetical protein
MGRTVRYLYSQSHNNTDQKNPMLKKEGLLPDLRSGQADGQDEFKFLRLFYVKT